MSATRGVAAGRASRAALGELPRDQPAAAASFLGLPLHWS